MDWTRIEVEAIVADYLQMLTLELLGQKFNKTEHRRNLQRNLVDRSEGSIEFKHGNISAALIEMGFPYLQGYKPRANYQSLVGEVLAHQIKDKLVLDQAALAVVQTLAVVPTGADFSKVRTEAPKKSNEVKESSVLPLFRAVKRDYLEREARNQSLGLAGEEFVAQFEHWRLLELGEKKLAERVEHVSRSRGDGLGYDVLSFDSNGRERFIEVKTTTFGRETPFFVSRGELALSKIADEQFHLYRLFEFRKTPKLFDLRGALETHCVLDPVSYRASFS
jgi:hypothetical protein